MKKPKKKSFLHRHSLSLAAAAVLLFWIILYRGADSSTHWGAFYGNAIADWTGVLVTVLATKFFYEKGSAESQRPAKEPKNPVLRILLDHSLVLFLLLTGVGWTVLYLKMDSQAKWGQVVGNIVSEWTQLIGLVLLTKKLIEQHSKESH